MKSVSFSFKPLSHIDVFLDAVDDHFQRDEVLAALGNNEVRVFLAGLNELLVHGLDRREVLLDDGVNGPAALFDVAPDSTAQAHIRVRVNEDFDVHLIAKDPARKNQNALDHDDLARLDGDRFGRTVVDRVVVGRAFDCRSAYCGGRLFFYCSIGNDDYSPGTNEWYGTGNTTDVSSVSTDSRQNYLFRGRA